MDARPQPVMHPPFPINELDQIEAAIVASQQCLIILQSRRDALTFELEKITRPQVVPVKPSRRIGPGLEYLGRMTPHWNYIDIYVELLRRLWTDYPGLREAMAQAVSSYGNTRSYVARTPEALFPCQPLTWALRHSRPLVDGWYLDTNLNLERMRRILPAAVRTAGLKWGTDVKAYWRATVVSV